MKLNTINSFFLVCLVSLVACQSNTQSTKNEEANKSDEDKDTIALVDISKINTSTMSPFSIDSLKMVNKFQAAANEFTTGFKRKNADIYVKYMLPSLIKMSGGKDKFLTRMKKTFKTDTINYTKMISGPVRRVEAAIDPKGNVTGWYCLMPVRSWVAGAKDDDCRLQWLAGQTLDGNTIYFFDITGIPKEMIYRVIPDFHFLLDKELAQ